MLSVQVIPLCAGRGLSNGLWHDVRIHVTGFQAAVSLDDESPSSVTLGSSPQLGIILLIGGSATGDGMFMSVVFVLVLRFPHSLQTDSLGEVIRRDDTRWRRVSEGSAVCV